MVKPALQVNLEGSAARIDPRIRERHPSATERMNLHDFAPCFRCWRNRILRRRYVSHKSRGRRVVVVVRLPSSSSAT